SLVDAVLLRSLPVKAPEQLVQFKWLAGRGFKGFSYDGSSRRDEATGLRLSSSFPQQTFEQFRDHQNVLTDLFAFAQLFEQVNANVDGLSEASSGLVVSGGYFGGLGVQPALGRMITPEDDRSGAPAVVVLSHRYWERRFGANNAVIGKQINLNNAAFTIVGVTPPEFAGTMGGGSAPDLTVPMMMEPLIRGSNTSLNEQNLWWLLLMGRLRPGATAEQAQTQLETVFQNIALQSRNRPHNNQPEQLAPQDYPRLTVVSAQRGDTDGSWDERQSLYLLMTIVALVLLIACTNVANLLLASAAERQKEIAVRLALGAGRFRLIRQLLTEALMLATVGGVFGLIFANWGRDLLLKLRFPGQEFLPYQT
ncbi:MAG: ABC transporter permease, partial [Pyrinomonadaceae bacterium]